MFEHVMYYQFGFFAPNTRLEPKPDIIGSLLEAFKGKNLIPTTIQELQIQNDPVPTMRLQLQFTSPQGEWNLAFEPRRVLLKKQNVVGIEIGSPETFCSETKDILGRLLGVHPLIGTRLSYSTKGLLPEMPAARLIEINSQLINLPSFYKDHLPYQWTTRNVAKFDVQLGEKTEAINAITDINRSQGTITTKKGQQSFDRMEIGVEINTYQENTTVRFGNGDIGLFLQEAIKNTNDIMSQIGKTLNG